LRRSRPRPRALKHAPPIRYNRQAAMDTPNPILDGKQVLDIADIMAILPHRYPFLLIDRLMEIERKKRIVAIKNVTVNEPFFAGHFPSFPIMPGVLIVEAIAQAGGALLLTEIPDRENKLMVFTGIERAKFRRPVVPGDQLRIEINVLNWRPRAVRMEGRVTVEGKLVCEAVVMCQLVPRTRETAAIGQPAAEPVIAE
ncbi:MAG TPA: 3-hydroxyacyl-ACP dehydratase FabZ, partial [Bryobacteraceae bacterium]|nr:3-hydroxyacyl-ACP dehydratase FabZ [Bryobacteraceae bacterium]